MAKIDIPTKRLIQIRPGDWVKAIVQGCKDEWITEMRPDKVLGLYPLLPLMENSLGETDESIIENTVTTISYVEDTALQADLLAAMSILAGEKFSADLVIKHVRRELLMGSPLFDEWVEDEKKEAAEKAAAETALATSKNNLIDLLSGRFEFVPKSIRDNIQKINDLELLKELFKSAIKIPALDDFRILLDKALENQ